MGKREPVVTSWDQLSFDAMAAFIGSLNGNAGDHIGYFRHLRLCLTPPTMTTPRPHEVHNLVSELLARKEFEQALQWDGSAKLPPLPHHHG